MPVSNRHPSQLAGVSIKKRLITRVVSNLKTKDLSKQSYTAFCAYVAKNLGVSVTLLLRKDGHYHELMRGLYHSKNRKPPEKLVEPTLNPDKVRIRELEHQLEARDRILKDINKRPQLLVTTDQPPTYHYQFEKTCMLVSKIIEQLVELEFTDARLMNLATFTGEPELVADRELTSSYLEWKGEKKRINCTD